MTIERRFEMIILQIGSVTRSFSSNNTYEFSLVLSMGKHSVKVAASPRKKKNNKSEEEKTLKQVEKKSKFIFRKAKNSNKKMSTAAALMEGEQFIRYWFLPFVCELWSQNVCYFSQEEKNGVRTTVYSNRVEKENLENNPLKVIMTLFTDDERYVSLHLFLCLLFIVSTVFAVMKMKPIATLDFMLTKTNAVNNQNRTRKSAKKVLHQLNGICLSFNIIKQQYIYIYVYWFVCSNLRNGIILAGTENEFINMYDGESDENDSAGIESEILMTHEETSNYEEESNESTNDNSSDSSENDMNIFLQKGML